MHRKTREELLAAREEIMLSSIFGYTYLKEWQKNGFGLFRTPDEIGVTRENLTAAYAELRDVQDNDGLFARMTAVVYYNKGLEARPESINLRPSQLRDIHDGLLILEKPGLDVSLEKPGFKHSNPSVNIGKYANGTMTTVTASVVTNGIKDTKRKG